jgi:hypothetical protein
LRSVGAVQNTLRSAATTTGSGNENIRRLVCFYLGQTQSKTSLRKLLHYYLTHGPYFYNVVALLDRALYAPKVFRDFHLSEEKQFFERWKLNRVPSLLPPVSLKWASSI